MPDNASPPPLSTPDVPQDGGSACSSTGTNADCEKCCAMQEPDGGAAYLGALNACACAPTLCGSEPGDGGGDGGSGEGACVAECASGTETKDPACNACRTHTLAPDGGACYAQVKSACEGDPACQAYVECASSCPAK